MRRGIGAKGGAQCLGHRTAPVTTLAAGRSAVRASNLRRSRGELARELLQRLSEDACDLAGEAIYRDPKQGAVAQPGAIPAQLHDFARDAMLAALKEPDAFSCVLGEYLTEPKANVWFEAGQGSSAFTSVALDRRSRMMYDEHHVFINGEGFRASGRDAAAMRRLADLRELDAAALAALSDDARALLLNWIEAGWAHGRQ